MNCGTCKYFGEELEIMKSGKKYKTGFHKCDLINMYEDTIYKDKEKAFVKDGSGYYAALVVSEDFGCINWENG